MPIRLTLGQRVFAPSWSMTLAMLVLLAAFVALGRWQWERAEQKRALWSLFESGRDAITSVTGVRALEDPLPRYAHVRLQGRYDGSRQFLIDNQIHEGQAGYQVLTPVALAGGGWVLVNRGWVPFGGYRDRLPDVSMAGDAGETSIVGRIDALPVAGLAAGRAPPATVGDWPRLTSYPRPEELAAALGVAPDALASRQILLDADQPQGYVRAWRPPGMPPERHWSYAIQWWSFAVVLVILWIALNLRRRSPVTRPRTDAP